jgi:hypothetical protein
VPLLQDRSAPTGRSSGGQGAKIIHRVDCNSYSLCFSCNMSTFRLIALDHPARLCTSSDTRQVTEDPVAGRLCEHGNCPQGTCLVIGVKQSSSADAPFPSAHDPGATEFAPSRNLRHMPFLSLSPTGLVWAMNGSGPPTARCRQWLHSGIWRRTSPLERTAHFKCRTS